MVVAKYLGACISRAAVEDFENEVRRIKRAFVKFVCATSCGASFTSLLLKELRGREQSEGEVWSLMIVNLHSLADGGECRAMCREYGIEEEFGFKDSVDSLCDSILPGRAGVCHADPHLEAKQQRDVVGAAVLHSLVGMMNAAAHSAHGEPCIAECLDRSRSVQGLG